MRWDQIESVELIIQDLFVRKGFAPLNYSEEYRGRNTWVTIRIRDGRKVVLRNFGSLQELGNQIQMAVSEALLPQYEQALESGQRLSFGKLSLDKEALYHRQKAVPWSEIRSIKIAKGMIQIDKSPKVLSVRTGQTPNVLVFLALAGRFTTVE